MDYIYGGRKRSPLKCSLDSGIEIGFNFLDFLKMFSKEHVLLL